MGFGCRVIIDLRVGCTASAKPLPDVLMHRH